LKYLATSLFVKRTDILCKKKSNCYHGVLKDLNGLFHPKKTVREIHLMSDTVTNVTEDDVRLVLKTRCRNSIMKEGKKSGFRLISILDIKLEEITFIQIYPKKGALEQSDLTEEEYAFAIETYIEEKIAGTLIQLDVEDNFKIIEKLEEEEENDGESDNKDEISNAAE
jgi:hypothetical protein